MGLYSIPDYISGKLVSKKLKKNIICPFCNSQNTSDEADTGWVECPIRTDKSEWICYGCCIDISSTCISDNFEEHPYYDIVKEAAENEGRTVNDARRICLNHQLEIINESNIDKKKPEYFQLKEKIFEQLAGIEPSN